MFVRIKRSNTRKLTAVQLVEGVRDPISGKVKQKVIRHIGSAATEEEIEQLAQLGEYIKFELEAQVQPNLFDQEEYSNSNHNQEDKSAKRPKNQNYSIDDIRNLRHEYSKITGIHEVYGKIFDNIGFSKILKNPARKIHSAETIKNIVLARIANPQSKRETVRFLDQEYGINLKLDSVYNAMKKIDEHAIDRIQSLSLHAVQNLFKEKIDILFYDATTLYFESFTEDELKSKGFSKDNKFNQVQVMLTIFVTQQGMPIGYDVFPGSTYEGHTLITALNNLKNRFEINKVVFVADSGMLNRDNLNLLEQEGYNYIVGARIKNMDKDTTRSILNNEDYEDISFGDDIYQGKTIALKDGKSLVLTYSDKRARKDANDRSESVKKMMKKLEKSKDVKSSLSNSGYKKYLQINGDSKLVINEEKIEEDSKWDGLHGVITNCKDQFSIKEIISQYKGLWQVEETFRISKHDLRVRPIYHWTEQKIRAHIAICFMSLVCIRHLEYRVNLQRTKMSPERIRKSLVRVGYNVVCHQKDKRLFAIPNNIPDDAKIIYRSVNLNISDTPYLL